MVPKTLDFWSSNRHCQYLVPYQKSSAWIVCRRRYGHYIFGDFAVFRDKRPHPKIRPKKLFEKHHENDKMTKIKKKVKIFSK